jgi:4-hydroxythreonine-4-phosphate dehydrogenase
MHLAEVPYPGHTELLAAITNTKRFCMMLASDKITVSLATTHIGLDDVCAQLSVQRITDVIHLTADVMSRLRGRPARIVVCGLNPHAGEHGVLGHGEEEEVILPAVTEAKQNGIDIVGPLPPDTAFLPGRLRTTDAFVCMYHDQGLIPLKMLSFDSAINVTLGLPIVRTSPAHGTAFDIAWNGSASPESLIRAVLLAARLSRADAGP